MVTITEKVDEKTKTNKSKEGCMKKHKQTKERKGNMIDESIDKSVNEETKNQAYD